MDKNRIDVMVDIETLGTGKDATIFQISAIAFEIETAKRLDEFDMIADISKNNEMNVDGGTLKWWLNTDAQLLKELLNEGHHSSSTILYLFRDWLMKQISVVGKENVYLWGNGILFDNAMIQHQMNNDPDAVPTEYPIYYKNDRDVRTIVELASEKLGISIDELKKQYIDDSLTEHDAFDDCVYQIELVVGCYKTLIGSDE